AFLDILGFSEIVSKSSGLPAEEQKLIKAVEEIADYQKKFSEVEPDDLMVQAFSDCIVMSEAASPKGLTHQMVCLSVAFVELITRSIFVRGAITNGQLHQTPQVVLGPALIKAYRLESTITRYPRILVDEPVHRDFQSSACIAAREEWASPPRIALADDGP